MGGFSSQSSCSHIKHDEKLQTGPMGVFVDFHAQNVAVLAIKMRKGARQNLSSREISERLHLHLN